MKKTNLIYFPGGCYGTFIEWLCQHFYSKSALTELPFTKNGSSHKYLGNILCPPNPKLFNYLESDCELKFARTTCSIFEEVNSKEKIKNYSREFIVNEDLEFLKNKFNKILVLHPSPQNKLWLHGNVLEKCLFSEYDIDLLPHDYESAYMTTFIKENYDKELKTILQNELTPDKTMCWNKSSLNNLEHWEFRELLSLYWFERDGDMFDCWNKIIPLFPEIKFVSIDNLKKHTTDTFKEILNYFEISTYNDKDLETISNEWHRCQYNKNKDQDVQLILTNVLNNIDYDWSHLRLSILDEALIQKELKEKNIEIKCYRVNKFPTNTKEFQNLLIFNS